ncbi:MAG: hypothetical protein ACFFBD_00445 [Candidatus Hodarchaeota archaeon]
MKEGKVKRIGKRLCQKNILFTLLAFAIGLTLQLADTTIILLILGVSAITTWWQWRPVPINAESQLILDTLTKYPAVVIKNHSHIIAFSSNPPSLAAAYQSPLPPRVLKHYLNRMETVEVSIGTVGLESFLLLKSPLTRYISPKTVFRTFQDVIEFLELQLQATLKPAERYQTLRLFGLENYLDTPETTPLKTSNQPNVLGQFQSPLTSHKTVKSPLLLES